MKNVQRKQLTILIEINMEKRVRINKPMPEKLKEAIAKKQEWVQKVQAGEMPDSTKNKPKTVV